MAGGGNFVGKIMSYVVNELVVNGLANSRAFQRFAVRTSKRMEDLTKTVQEKKIDLAEQMKDFSRNMEETFKDRR